MPTCSKMQHFDIQREASLSWIPNQPGVRSTDAVSVGVHLLQAQSSTRVRAFKRERSQRRENRDDAEASQRLTESCAKVKLLSMQGFECCRVKSFTGFTFLPNTLSKYETAKKTHSAVCKTAECWQIFYVLLIKSEAAPVFMCICWYRMKRSTLVMTFSIRLLYMLTLQM